MLTRHRGKVVRLAYVTESWPPETSGGARCAEQVVRYLREHGHVVDLIRPCQRGEADAAPPAPAADGAEQSEWRTTAVSMPWRPELRFGIASPAALRARFRAQRAQLVHVATHGPLGRAALLAAESLGLPVTTDFRADFRWHRRFYRADWLEAPVLRYLRRLHNRAARTFVPTYALRDKLSHHGFVRLEVSGRAVDPLLFWPGRRSVALRSAWDAGDETQLVLLYVGRLAPEHNVALALRTFEAIRYLQPGTRMVVVGDGPLRARLQQQFPAATFAGVQRGEALAQHYASADLFLFPCVGQSHGQVALEALASGLAVVAFDCAAANELVRSEHNGVLVAPGDEAGFIGAAARAAAFAERHSPMRLHARETALGCDRETTLRRFAGRLTRIALGQPPDRGRTGIAVA
jgi:glycosyltransferase involved in cell wall biosynthesis